MSNVPSSDNTKTPDRPNTLHKKKRDEERCEAVWDNLAGFVQYCYDHNMDDHQTASTVLFVETLAEQMAHNKTTIDDVTCDLIVGHHHLNQLVSRRLLEQMVDLNLIKQPVIMDHWTRQTKSHIARRALWDLDNTAKKYLDMAYLRGYAKVKHNEGPHAGEQDVRDLRGDPNESIVHQYFIRALEHYYRHVEGYATVRTYVRLGDLTDVDEEVANRLLDVVVHDKNGNIAATAEAELHPMKSNAVTRDAEAMALLPGDSDWLVYSKGQVNDLLHTMDGHLIQRPEEVPGWDKRDTARTDAIDRLRRVWNSDKGRIPTLESPIVTDVNTIDNLRGLINEAAPWVFNPIDPTNITWAGDRE